MITVTRLNGTSMVLNAELLEHLENTPDTLISLTTGIHLSAARATTVLRDFIHENHSPPGRLSASANHKFRPVATNDTPEGRSRHRRVELVTSPLGTRAPATAIAGSGSAPPVAALAPGKERS